MSPFPTLLVIGWFVGNGDVEPAHAKNEVYEALLAGVTLDAAPVRLPAPSLRDAMSAADQKAALKALSGGDRPAAELLADSITAPFILKVRDEKTPGGSILRMADLVFAIHADFAKLDPAEAARRAASQVTDVANMRVETKILNDQELATANLPPSPAGVWRSHLSARLLGRIAVEATDEVVVTRSEGSLIVASRCDSRFDRSKKFPNGWKALDRDGKPAGEPKPYAGGISYTKISRWADSPGILVVEAHFAFVEPRPWFDGAPILRSKFAPIAQDQVRRLRRESKAEAR